MGTKKGQYRKTSRRAYEKKRMRKQLNKKWDWDFWLEWPFDFLKMKRKGK